MGFFAEFNTWLNGLLARYIADNTAAIARILEPAIVTLGVFYVVIWGYLQLIGKIEQPFAEGVKRLLTLALILGLSLHLWLYNEVIVDTFFDAPTTLAAGIIADRNPGAPAFDPVGVADQIFFDGDDAASLLMQKGEIFGREPIFMALLFFESTKKFFEAWIAQLSNYAFLTILTVLIAVLMLHVVTVAAQAAAANGGDITIADALKVCVAAALTFLIMKQVPSMAQGLASGIALSGLGAVGNVLRAGLGLTGGATKRVKDFSRGALIDRDRSRWDSLSRKAGQRLIGLRMPREKRPRPNTLQYG
jgi:type IV secretion system protein VirB6